ncbi:MAG: hypothetical protein ACOZDD_06785 [Bacteroidota bacterium]
MKTIILFSSIFYLIGLKIGSTIEGVKNAIIPSKSIITAPLKKSERSEKNYHFKSEEKETEKEADSEKKDSGQDKGSAKLTAPVDTIAFGQG